MSKIVEIVGLDNKGVEVWYNKNMSIHDRCTVDGCNKLQHAKLMCTPHYYRFKNYGDTAFAREQHGLTSSSEYVAWKSMKRRTSKPEAPGYHNYGGRGIKVCGKWKNSFENFYADMGIKPTPLHTLERIDNDGNYEPGNCRWATRREQANNRRQFEGTGWVAKKKRGKAFYILVGYSQKYRYLLAYYDEAEANHCVENIKQQLADYAKNT